MIMELLNKAAQTGAFVGDWFQVDHDGRAQIPVAVSLKAGTATIVLEGRNSGNDTPVVIDSRAASGGYLANTYRQLRVNLTAATGATVVVSVAGRVHKTV
jgi:hypothetical protein